MLWERCFTIDTSFELELDPPGICHDWDPLPTLRWVEKKRPDPLRGKSVMGAMLLFPRPGEARMWTRFVAKVILGQT